MKKIITFLCIVWCGFSAFGQTSDHLTFRDVPLDGNIHDFVKQMEGKGFVKEKDVENGVKMNGKFVNLECELYIFCTPKSRIVYQVGVYAPKKESWYSLKSDFKSFKEQYTTKYGKPEKTYEFFSDPYYEGGGYEIQALSKEKCHYLSYWGLKEGTIMVQISKFAQICFTYEDKINSEKATQERKSTVQDEI